MKTLQFKKTAALKSIKPIMVLATLSAGCLLTNTSQAATSTYYNCAGNDGCKPVKAFSWEKTQYTQTKYPLVMAHGMAGWTKMVGLVDYYYGIVQDLAKNGTQVYTTQVPAFNATLVRNEAFLQEVEDVLAVSGAEKVNLLGHSHGAADVRYAMANMSNKVASVTTVGGVNHGSKTADGIVGLENDEKLDWVPEVLYGFFSYLIGPVFSTLSGEPKLHQDSKAQIRDLTTKNNAIFNESYPAGLPKQYCNASTTDTEWNGIKMYSFSGATVVTNAADISDYFLLASAKAYDKSEPNDGLVNTCSSHFGKVVRDDYRMNHLDQMNHFFGLVSWYDGNPVSIYRKHVNMLKKAGV